MRKNILITGANSGIGFATAAALLHQGHRLLLLCRTLEKAEQTKSRLLNSGSGEVCCYGADFSSLDDVSTAAEQILGTEQQLDVLVNNAGLFSSQPQQSADGYELTFAVNHLAPMLLTLKLLPLLKGTADEPSRIVNVASGAHRRGRFNVGASTLKQSYNSGRAYGQSKLFNILFAAALDKRLGSVCMVNSLHPGVVATSFAAGEEGSYGFLFRFFKRWMRTPEQGAETVIYLSTSPEIHGVGGRYFKDCRPATPSAQARSEVAAEQLWDWSIELLRHHLGGVYLP